ncbi:MAG: tetratricopeptide repeat protein [Planctomycetota bacterium]
MNENNESQDVPQEPQSPIDAKFNHAHELLQQGDFVTAIDLFSEVIQACPEMEGAWGNRGYGNYELGRDAEALADFDQVVQINPSDAFGYGFRSLVLRNLGRYEEALESAVYAIDLAEGEEGVPPAHLVRGWLFMRAGQVDAAYDDLATYMELTPDDPCVQPMLELARREQEVATRICVDGPEGKLACGVCQNSACGYSFNSAPNTAWEECGGRCAYSHCIETFPQRNGDGPGICPLYGHDCPGGPEVLKGCEVVENELGYWNSEGGVEPVDALFSPEELPALFRSPASGAEFGIEGSTGEDDTSGCEIEKGQSDE